MKKLGLYRPKKKSLGIPNIYPRKKELLEEIQAGKEAEERIRKSKLTSDTLKVEPSPLKENDQSLKRLMKNSDLILQLVDSRDPRGYFHPKIQGKNMILVLTKVDLIPPEVAENWLRSFSDYNSLLFSTASEEYTVKLKEVIDSFGPSISIVVVGLPNVGKTSLVNCLRNTKISGVSSHPGFTKVVDKHEIDNDVTVIDTPPIIRKADDSSEALRSLTNIEDTPDPFTPVQGMLKLIDRTQLMVLYAIPQFSDLNDFLKKVAFKNGKVKAGKPDYDFAARTVLHDWAVGNLPYYIAN